MLAISGLVCVIDWLQVVACPFDWSSPVPTHPKLLHFLHKHGVTGMLPNLASEECASPFTSSIVESHKS